MGKAKATISKGNQPKGSIRGLFRELASKSGGTTLEDLRKEATKRGLLSEKTTVGQSDGVLRFHVVGAAKRMGWKVRETDEGKFYATAPATKGKGKKAA